MRVQIVLCRQGTEMMDGPLMGEFEGEVKDLEADSWSLCVEQQYLQILDREVVKRQDVIYGTSDHHTDLCACSGHLSPSESCCCFQQKNTLMSFWSKVGV